MTDTQDNFTLEPDPIDDLLSEHFRHELDGQVGRAIPAFREHLRMSVDGSMTAGGSSSELLVTRVARWGRTRNMLRFATVAGGAMAATLVLMASLQGPQSSRLPDSVPGSSSSVTVSNPSYANPPYQVQQETQRRLENQGIVVGEDGVPMRRIRVQEMKRVRWKDPKTGAVMERLVPQDRTIVIETLPY